MPGTWSSTGNWSGSSTTSSWSCGCTAPGRGRAPPIRYRSHDRKRDAAALGTKKARAAGEGRGLKTGTTGAPAHKRRLFVGLFHRASGVGVPHSTCSTALVCSSSLLWPRVRRRESLLFPESSAFLRSRAPATKPEGTEQHHDKPDQGNRGLTRSCHENLSAKMLKLLGSCVDS